MLAVFIDIPKHQISFPFNCPGVCLKIGAFSVNQEIKTHLGLDLQGGTQLILRMQTEKLPIGTTTPQSDLQTQAISVIDRRINGLGVSEPVIQGLGDDKILLELPGIEDLAQANDLATRQAFLEVKVPDKDHPGQKLHFKRVAAGEGGYSTFADANGWTMTEATLGQPSAFRYGRFFANLALNGLHLVLWFLCLWLLLRFQWPHALGLAAALWLVTTLTLLWYLLPQAGAAAGAR